MNAFEVHVDPVVCKGCALCILYCPKNVLQMSEKRNVRGYTSVQAYEPSDCVGCKLCEVSCPDLAIYIEDVITS